MPKAEFKNIDCLDYLYECEDDFFDLAVVDPPYGIGKNWKKDRRSDFYTHESTYCNDQIPSKEYFEQLFRVSQNQIIWGANYFTDYLPPRNSWLVWDKQRDYKKQHMAEGELAWTSFNEPLRIIPLLWNGFATCETRYGKHPHEKPVKLYQWIFENYCLPGQKVLDTHLGSNSIGVAAHYAGVDFLGIEIDKHYFETAVERFDFQTRQMELKT